MGQSALLKAAESGNVKTLQNLLKAPLSWTHDVNEHDSKKM